MRETFVIKGLDAVLTRKKRETPPIAADFRRRGPGEVDRAGLLRTAAGLCPLDHPAAGGACRRAQNRAGGALQYGRPRAKKNELKPHLTEYWVIPPKANAAFVAAMEDVLDVYTRPHDPARPLVCLDETSKQLVAETRTPIPMQPGQPARHDYEYKRNGMANPFMLFAPLEGLRHVKITERRTAIDYAHVLQDLSDIHFPKADKIVLVQDNLNTHSPASLYEAFEPAEARRLIERFEWHYTPKHGSWLNLAESELGRSLRPVPRPPHRRRRHAHNRGRRMGARRNAHNAKAIWHFTSADARVKLKSLYPAL